MKDRWVLSFEATGEGPPVEIRIRRLLKTALRAYDLRCVHVENHEVGKEVRPDKKFDTTKKDPPF
jgi:hypothetical protein